jgi:hypothetical protein
LHQPTLSSPPDFIQSGHFQCAVAQIESDSISGAWGFSNWDTTGLPMGILFAMTFLMMMILLVTLKRRDPV